jgi:hypothetical protein
MLCLIVPYSLGRRLPAFCTGLFDQLDVDRARRDAAPFVKDQELLSIWSRDFFRDVAGRIGFVEVEK